MFLWFLTFTTIAQRMENTSYLRYTRLFNDNPLCNYNVLTIAYSVGCQHAQIISTSTDILIVLRIHAGVFLFFVFIAFVARDCITWEEVATGHYHISVCANLTLKVYAAAINCLRFITYVLFHGILQKVLFEDIHNYWITKLNES